MISYDAPPPDFRPRYVNPPGLHNWIEHLPFAKDIVLNLKPSVLVELGTHYGESYFGLCQSVKEIGTDCDCYAVDTWAGDAHSGRYGEEVFQRVSAYNTAHYGDFSKLLRTTFDAALECFGDRTISLLHIDGLHTYDAVLHDFSAWFPKVSDGGLILLHDTAVRHSDFGVWRLWSELVSRLPSFEFHHGNGLGVILKPGGSSCQNFVSEMISADAEHQEVVRRYYHLLGVRLRKEVEDIQPETKIQLLWPDGDNYTEMASLIRYVALGKWQEVCFDLGKTPVSGSLRLDPGDVAGTIEIDELIVSRSTGGAPLWRLASSSMAELHPAGTSVHLPNSGQFCVLSYGDDPQLILPPLAELETDLQVTARLRINRGTACVPKLLQPFPGLHIGGLVASPSPHVVENLTQTCSPSDLAPKGITGPAGRRNLTAESAEVNLVGPKSMGSGRPTRTQSSSIEIIIPFYRNPELVAPLFASLERIADELMSECAQVTVILDSPDDLELQEALEAAVGQLSVHVPARVLRNEQNLGFVRSVNRAAQMALAANHDLLVLNSDTILFPGVLGELKQVAYLDPMTGFVSPRSNNATICTLPHPPQFQKQEPEDAYRNFQELSKYLPRFQYAPTAVGFCLYIRQRILEEFGLFDEIYGHGYNEENDLIMRANRAGYRAVLANHAFVYHVGETSFASSDSPRGVREKTNAALLQKRYPEYMPAVRRYFDSPVYEAEEMLTALLPDALGRLDLVFDFSSVGPYYNGTFEAAKHILQCATESWAPFFNLYVMVSDEALRFHELDRLKNVFLVPPEIDRVFAVAFRFGQPFEYRQLFKMSRMGVLNIYGMPDPIAYDCFHLQHANLEVIWGTVFQYADAVMYVSNFGREVFHNRFRIRPTLKEIVAYHSLDYCDYVNPDISASTTGEYILVIGNGFAHKRLPETVDALSNSFPRQKIVVIGLPNHGAPNVLAYSSGHLSNEQVRNLFLGARFVVFPSHYEGFGIPVVESLAYGKPVLARSIPVMRDLRQRLNAADSLILFDSTQHLIEILKAGFPTVKPSPQSSDAGATSWAAVTRQIRDFLREAVTTWSYSNDLLPRLEHMRLLQEAVASATRRTVIDPEGGAQGKLSPALVDERIAAIYNSYSWRITAPLRKTMDVYLRLRGK